ncbi:MAG TPA: PilT/PilU family type 4a pilus ATPase [Acidimicrobiia bacterium]|nr:PilT/PilU family type 4a pilus ATPase [Acidimicrobiia bacterium]
MAIDMITKRVGQALVDDNLLSVDAFAEASAATAMEGGNVVRQLIDSGIVRKVDVLRKVAGLAGVEFYDPSAHNGVDRVASNRLPAKVAVDESALPIRMSGDRLVVGVVDPFDLDLERRLTAEAKCPVTLVLVPKEGLEAAVRRAYTPQDAEGSNPALAGGRVGIGATAPNPAGAEADEPDFHINHLLEELIDMGGSDLHLTAGTPPRVRVNGELKEMPGYGVLLPGPLRSVIYAILTARQREELEDKLELDASHPLPARGRFRVNVFFQRGSVGAVMRAIPNDILPLEDLGMPPAVREFGMLPRGLVLVTGATGSGKSTTLASLVDLININRSVHIMTIEDPIEFMHKHKKAVVNQREVGADTGSFANALRHALRQDPDVILLGEMRDLETISTALTAAETGHLVLATLHTQDAAGTVERMIDVFPPHQQQQVRVQLAEALQGVVSQQLIPTFDGRGRAASVEVMVVTPAIRNLIREGKVHQIRSAIQSGARHGMQSMDSSLASLVRAGKISRHMALERAHSVDELNNLMGGGR